MCNTGIIHKECGEERRKFWQANNKETIIRKGDFVKKLFNLDGFQEHMWVEVEEIEGVKIKGRLANDPQKIKSIKDRDIVFLDRLEISELIKTNN